MSNITLRKSSVRANPDKQPPEVFHYFQNYFAKFTEKHVLPESVFNKVAGLRAEIS